MNERIDHLAHLYDEVVYSEDVNRRGFGREAVRVVMIDDENRVALLHAQKLGIHKLPGGGIIGEENLSTALKREVYEETGHALTDVQKLGIVSEDRHHGDLFQISHCYMARGQYVEEPHFTQDEQEDDFSLVWATSIPKAIELVTCNAECEYDDIYATRRDVIILEAAEKRLENRKP